MNAAAWLAEFARRDEAWRQEREAFHREVGERIRAEVSAGVRAPPMVPVVFESERFEWEDFDDDDFAEDLPRAARRVARVALSTGWATWAVRARAALPTKGLIVTWSARARRHDEGLVAVWRNGAFDSALYCGPTGLERLAAARVAGRRTVLDALNGVGHGRVAA